MQNRSSVILTSNTTPPALDAVEGLFPTRITATMKALIDADNPHDPIAAQFMPREDELTIQPDELGDPISDFAFSPVKGIVHRHPDRVLLKPLMTCPVNCRFCFRREQLGDPDGTLLGAELDNAIDYIAAHPEVWEVILTGGDPLMLNSKHLAEIVRRLNTIAHVKIIRVHTRVPVVDPARVTDAMVAAFKGRATVYVLLHSNHPRELTDAARAACARFINAGIPMLSQSALLRGVNDTVDVLEELMRTFVECRITPYYLHHLDKTRGTSHFRVPLSEGQDLMRQLRTRLSGIAQPTYVLDIPGGHGKVPVSESYLTKESDGWTIKDHKGRSHIYKE
jgi:lysine 2,3-aminomutase